MKFIFLTSIVAWQCHIKIGAFFYHNGNEGTRWKSIFGFCSSLWNVVAVVVKSFWLSELNYDIVKVVKQRMEYAPKWTRRQNRLATLKPRRLGFLKCLSLCTRWLCGEKLGFRIHLFRDHFYLLLFAAPEQIQLKNLWWQKAGIWMTNGVALF